MNTNLNRILIAPHLTEKSMDKKETQSTYVFRVLPSANKTEIKKAIEAHFGVKVEKVATTNVRAQKRRVGRYMGKTAAWKKAYVTIQPGSGEIEYFEGT